MKKIYTFLFSCFLIFTYSLAQPAGQWTWMSGVQGVTAPVWGTQGVPSVNNHPDGLYEAVDWTDNQGNFWIYGGSNLSGGIYYGDLWKYNPSTNEWTWVFGTGISNVVPVYGTRGVASPTNTPGSRGYGSCTWVDGNNNLWMFGGWCYGVFGELNDLWMYDISSNEWTWVSGTTTVVDMGTYGTQGVPSVSNCPSARLEGPCFWRDPSNNFWLFGGEASNLSKIDDVWRYNPSTNEWTWMAGNHITSAVTVYGTRGIPNINNTPGGRQCYSHWRDLQGRFWLFGGTIYAAAGAFADMWRYDPLTNEWAWMSGSATQGSGGFYFSQCDTNSLAAPSSRFENKACWTDACGNFWMHAGFGDQSGSVHNDLWQYNPSLNRWRLVSGNSTMNAAGVYGTIGVSSATNLPPSRGGNMSFLDLSGNLWTYGGYSGSATSYGDLWRYVPDTGCGGCSPQTTLIVHFTSSDTAFCSETGECIDFFDHSVGNPTSWQWYFNGAIPDTSTLQNPTSICYFNPGTYSVTLVARNSLSSDSLVVSSLIIFTSPPPPPTITVLGGDTLISSHAAVYQWYFNGFPIAGATDSLYVALQGGTYAIRITDSLGCSVSSNGVLITEASIIQGEPLINIYPNPVSDELNIECNMVGKRVELIVADVLGKEILKRSISSEEKQRVVILSASDLNNGIYLLQINCGELILNRKFIVMHK